MNRDDVHINSSYKGGLEFRVWDADNHVEAVIRLTPNGKHPYMNYAVIEHYLPPKPPEPTTELVGVALHRQGMTPRECVDWVKDGKPVFTYKALADLDLTISDNVTCPVGVLDYVGGTVVTLEPSPTEYKMRTITHRAFLLDKRKVTR